MLQCVFVSGQATQTEDGKTQQQETGASLTEMLVESTFRQLKDAYEINDRQPISYFEFILDPTSFSKSVENMFHFSFLVKEGRATFDFDKDGTGLPSTVPKKPKKSTGMAKKTEQSVQNGENGETAENRHQVNREHPKNLQCFTKRSN